MDITVSIKNIRSRLDQRGKLFFSRKKARALRKIIINKRGYTKVKSKTKKLIKSYAKETFGSADYWPWLALYTEIRGDFIEGWLPDDYYTVHILKNDHSYFSRYLSDFKTLDFKLFPDLAIEPLFIVARGNFYNANGDKLTESKIRSFKEYYNNEIVIKKDFGLGGKQVNIIHSKQLDLKHFSIYENYVIQPLLKQHKNLNQVTPNSVNTLRILTSMNLSGKVTVKFSRLRFGIGKSRVDNSSSGGWSCVIEETGRVGKYAYNLLGEPMGEYHPTTNFKFENVLIPDYQQIVDLCIKNHHRVPFGKIIGWDIAIRKDSKPTLIEWNLDPLIWSPEALHGPFWNNEINELQY